MTSQVGVTPSTPMGANLVPGGATFRFWAPRASAVYLNGKLGGQILNGQGDDLLMAKDINGYWTGFIANVADGDEYLFWVVGAGSSGYKRDPYARGLDPEAKFPNCQCIVRAADSYPWHDQDFITPDFTNMIVYQIHIGTYAISTPGVASTFLDVIGKIPYLVELGINVLQPLPIDETESEPSMGYDGADLFSPDFPYFSRNPQSYVGVINDLLAARNCEPITAAKIQSGHAQLQCLIDLLHLYGIAVIFDVVYNHAGGFTANGALDDSSLFFEDRLPMGNLNDSLYFTDQDRGTGGLAFALWNGDVRQFLINNATWYIQELHADGFRYDEISILLSTNKDSGWNFCRDLTSTLRYLKPRLLQNAEYWQSEFSDYPHTALEIVTSVISGGTGFDTVQHDGLRTAIRTAIQSASSGAGALVSMSAIAAVLYPAGFARAWQTVPCIENHDLVKAGHSPANPRIPTLADSSNPESWYARSRTRVAMGLLLTSPGIPQLFMGQEFLEDKYWDTPPAGPNLLWWAGINPPAGSEPDKARVNHLRFTQDLIRLRWTYPALRGNNVKAFHVDDTNRVLVFQRWLDGSGGDIIIASTLAEFNWYNYEIGFPSAGRWTEVFNSDVYDNWVNPLCAGNSGGIEASGPPLHGLGASAPITIPANGFVVFART